MKEWDVSINRGILTGFNEAFIISGEKKRELISADPKSAEIIRPILRGRDINRYGYQFADLYLICTFPSRNYDIENFPAIKKHLLTFGYERLEQSGKCYIVNGEKIITRKKTNNKWFETQDSISYWDDFYKQKIVWGNLNLAAAYCIAESGIFVNAPCPMIVPANKYLLSVLNSKLADYYIRNLGVSRNGGYFEYKPMFVEQLPVPMLPLNEQEPFASLASLPNQENQREIDILIYKLYKLTTDEIALIENLA